MGRYPTEDLGVSFSIDKSVFGDMEAEAVLMDIRSAKSPVVDIGIGGTIATSPVVHNGVVYFGACDKNFYAVNAETGGLEWKFGTGDVNISSPAICEGIVYFGSCDNNFYALDAVTGGLVWKFTAQGQIYSTPAVHDGMVCFGSWDCNMYAVDMKGGLVWKFHTSMSNQSAIDIEETETRASTGFVWMPEADEKKGGNKEDASFSDYGELSGTYIEKEKSDYVSSRKKGYIR